MSRKMMLYILFYFILLLPKNSMNEKNISKIGNN